MKMRSMRLPVVGFVALLLGLLGGVSEAATLYVANNGLDSPTCGALASPCRSISQAIANANSGDRVVVGPGRYGDLDGDGAFTSPGEEAAEVDSGCDCMIHVDKTLTIESRAGAGATVLDAGGAPVDVVRIWANGVTFGKPKKGFTLIRGSSGLKLYWGSNSVRIAGNLATRNDVGGFVKYGGTGNVLSANMASANGENGFLFSFGGQHQLTHNLSTANVRSGFVSMGNAMEHQLIGNVATANGWFGFYMHGTRFLLSSNVASGNGEGGFGLQGSDHALSGNAAYGNTREGIRFESTVTGPTISRNNFADNGHEFSSLNCGLVNDTGNPVSATNNFWGASQGPGPDPADDVCDTGGGGVTFVPFAKKEFLIRTRPLF
jgi:parallel beta-helix repeat protein